MELITGWNILVLGTGNRAWPPVDLGHITSSLEDDAEENSHHGKTQRDAQIKIPSHQIGDKLTNLPIPRIGGRYRMMETFMTLAKEEGKISVAILEINFIIKLKKCTSFLHIHEKY